MKRCRRNKTIKSYEKILKNDFDWDWAFMLRLEKHKLTRMLKYFSTSGMTVSSKDVAKDISLAIKLIEIIQEEDTDYEDLKKLRINLKNYKRFVPYSLSQLDRSLSFRIALRVEKAWNLYNLLRKEKMRTWWD